MELSANRLDCGKFISYAPSRFRSILELSMSFLDTFSAALPQEIRLEDLKILVPCEWWHDKPERAAVSALCRCGKFDTQDYLERYPDVAQEGIDPVLHFVQHGITEKKYFKCLPDINYGESKVRLAHQYFQKGECEKALQLYEELADKIGAKNFAANIAICKKKLGSKDSLKFLAKEICKQHIRVSVIIPAYNSSEYIQECIDSLVSQTLKNVEFIFVDDGSTDATLDIIQKNALKDSRIKIISQQNQYAGVARNNGLNIASGEYIIFLDSDDFFDISLLEKTYNAAQKTGAEIVIFKGREYNIKTAMFNSCKFPLSEKLFPQKDIFTYKDFCENLYQANSCIAWNKLIKKSLIDKLGIKFQEIQSSNDTVFVYTLLVCASSMTFLNETLVNYRVGRDNSLQRSKSKNWECIFKAFYSLKQKLIEIGMYKHLKKTFLNKALHAIIYYINTTDYKTNIYIKAALKNHYMKLLDMYQYRDFIYNKSNYRALEEIISKNYIPIVYASDKSYLDITYISIKSIIKKIGKDSVAIINVLHDESVSHNDISRFEVLQSENCIIDFYNMKDLYSTSKINISHTSIATYFRLEIPNIFPFFDKIIYLDSDTIINCDIYELYSIDLNEYYAAGVKAIAFDNISHKKRLGIDTSRYLNAGVLLLNNKKIIEDHIYEKFLDLTKKEFSCQDQDILNIAFNGKVLMLEKYFNFMPKYVSNYVNNLPTKSKIKIIHYADKVKPWNDQSTPYSDLFWDTARLTPYYTKLNNAYNINNKFN